MSPRSRPRPPSSQPPTRPPSEPPTRPPADVRSFVVLVGWGVAVLAVVWATNHPVAALVAATSAVVVGVALWSVASAVARPVEWELSLRVPVLDCRVDVVFARPARGR